ncbi:MAG: hypothetical protein JWR16_953 [Nevskia sp.]|nr:hypothetical protein [Nevskia sp.]
MAGKAKQHAAAALRHFSRALLACIGLTLGVAQGDAAEPSLACDAQPGSVRLRLLVEGLHSARGNITVTVYPDDPKRFLAPHGKLARVRAPATQPTTQVCLRLPAADRYEVALYHDENDDHHFNRSWTGLPVEGTAFQIIRNR